MALTPEQHVALPALLGAPAYARPPRTIPPVPRPIDPDDFPIEAHRTDEDRWMLASGRRPAEPVTPALALPRFDARNGGWLEPATEAAIDRRSNGNHYGSQTSAGLQARTFNLRSVASRILGDH